jgi:hypothetical protein
MGHGRALGEASRESAVGTANDAANNETTSVPVENPDMESSVPGRRLCDTFAVRASCRRKERPLSSRGLGKRRLPIRRLPSKLCATPDFVRTIAHGRVAAVNCTP